MGIKQVRIVKCYRRYGRLWVVYAYRNGRRVKVAYAY